MFGRATLAIAVAAAVLASCSAAFAAKTLPADQKAAAIEALMARSEALNRLHHLGAYARPPAQELRALRLRSEALNRIYGLGRSTVAAPAGFHWGDAGIGSAATIGVLMLGIAGAATLRKRRQRPAQAV